MTAYSAASAGKDNDDDKMEVADADGKKVTIEKDANDLNIDYNLYSKFWKLQDFFRNPIQCYQKDKWLEFSKYATEVLKTFKSSKIDSVASSSRQYFLFKPQKILNVDRIEGS